MATVMTDPVRLEDLAQMARVGSDAGRRMLAENLTDLFISDQGRLSDRERALMTDILAKLVTEMERDVRHRLAQTLAARDDAPHDLVAHLSNDEIGVARPLLMQSRVLADADLIEIVKQRTEEHRIAVAVREGVSDVVADALIESGEENVLAALIENDDAQLSEAAMAYLVDQSRRVDRFQGPLLHRSDLPPVLAHRMFWWVSAALRRHILDRFELDPVELDERLAQAARQALADGVRLAPDRAMRLADEMARDRRLTEGNLVQVLRAGEVPLFVAGIARLLSLTSRAARRAIFDPGGEALAVACLAAGFERASFAAAFMLTGTGRGDRTARELTDVLAFYDGLEPVAAKRTVQCWRLDTAYLDAVDQVESGLRATGRKGAGT